MICMAARCAWIDEGEGAGGLLVMLGVKGERSLQSATMLVYGLMHKHSVLQSASSIPAGLPSGVLGFRVR